MFKLLPFATLSLWRRNRQRAALTTLAVSAATIVFTMVMVIPYAMTAIVNNADGSLRLAVTNRAAMNRSLPESYYRKVANLPGVIAVNRMTWFGGIYDDPKHQFPNMGIDADNPDVVWPEYAMNRTLVDQFRSHKDSALVGVATMSRFRWKVGKLVSLYNPAIPLTLTFRIIGTINQGPDLTIFLFHRDYLEEALRNPGQTSMLWVRTASVDDGPRIAAAIDEMFRNSSAETRTETEKEFMAQMVGRFRPLARIVQGIGLAAALAIALAVLNATSMTVRERRREIAVIKSLGFTASQVLSELAVESSIVALAGGVAGIALAAELLNRIRGAFPSLGPLLSFGLPAPLMAGGLVIAFLIGLAAGLAPAIGAVRSSVVATLHRVG